MGITKILHKTDEPRREQGQIPLLDTIVYSPNICYSWI